MRTVETPLDSAKATLVNTGGIEDLFSNYNRVLRLAVAEHDVALSGLGHWLRTDYGGGSENLSRFLAEREEVIVTTLENHSREVKDTLGMIPDIFDGLPDLSADDRTVYELALKEPILGGVGGAAAYIKEHGSSEEVIRAMLAATDIKAHDWVLNNPNAWIFDDVPQRQRAEDDFREMTSGRPARDAIRDSRNAVIYQKAENVPATGLLKTYASSAEARAALMAARDRSLIQEALQEGNISSARNLLAQGSDSIVRPGRSARYHASGGRRKRPDVSLNNQIVTDALRLNPDFEDVLFEEEMAAAKEQFMKRHPAHKVDRPVEPQPERRWRRFMQNGDKPEEVPRLTDEQIWDAWINEPKTPNSPKSKPEPKKVKILWEAERARVERKYPEVAGRQKAREQAETRRRAEEARRRAEQEARQKRQAEEEARQRASSSQSHSRRQTDYQNTHSTPPPRQEQKPPQPTELSKEELKTIYDAAVEELWKTRTRIDARSFEGFDRGTVYWVIDRIMKARRESEAHGKPVTDRTIYIQFMRLSGAANSHPKPEDEEAAKIINTMMGNPSGKLPF